jgi:hypothetical protein
MRSGSAPITIGVKYRPCGLMLWIQIILGGFFILFGLFILILGLNSSAAAVPCLVALFFFALAAFVITGMMGFRSQFVEMRDDRISFRLAPLETIFVFPWKLRSGDVPWSGVRAVDLKLRNLAGPQRIYVLRTSAGQHTFAWPQWPNADAIAQEIVRRSGATTSSEDMVQPQPAPIDPNNPQALPSVSRGERWMRGFGTAIVIISVVLGVLCVIGIFGAKPEDRWEIGKAAFFLLIAATTGEGLRRYRRIR